MSTISTNKMKFLLGKGGRTPICEPPGGHYVCTINCFAITILIFLVLNFTFQSWQVCVFSEVKKSLVLEQGTSKISIRTSTYFHPMSDGQVKQIQCDVLLLWMPSVILQHVDKWSFWDFLTPVFIWDLHYNLVNIMYQVLYTGLPLVREKSGKSKVREKSGNFRICQGNLEFCWKSGKFKKSQGNLRKFIFHKRLWWSIGISKNLLLGPLALASYFSTHFILNLPLFTKICYLKHIQGMYKMIIKIYHHMNT